MVGWHHQLNGFEFEQALGVGDGQCQGEPGVLQSMGSQGVGLGWATEQNWCDQQSYKEIEHRPLIIVRVACDPTY